MNSFETQSEKDELCSGENSAFLRRRMVSGI